MTNIKRERGVKGDNGEERNKKKVEKKEWTDKKRIQRDDKKNTRNKAIKEEINPPLCDVKAQPKADRQDLSSSACLAAT